MKVVAIAKREVEEHPKNFNSNKHSGDEISGLEPPISLEQSIRLIARTGYSRWQPLRPMNGEGQIRLSAARCRVLHAAAEIGCQTLRLTHLYDEELEPIMADIDRSLDALRAPNLSVDKFFVRLEGGSLKGGAGGHRPFARAKELVTAMVTNDRSRKELAQASRDGLTLHLLPWRDDMDKRREFRVFVHDEKVTAISQYAYMEDCGWSLASGELITLSAQVQELVVDVVRKNREMKLGLPKNFIMDVLWNEQHRAELVELNSFGAQNAAGSGLFHWIRDYEQLHGRKSTVEIRVLAP